MFCSSIIGRVRYGADRARKTRAPGPFPYPAPLNGLGQAVFFGIPCPCPGSGPRLTNTPDGPPLTMCGNKGAPSREWGGVGPGGGGAGSTRKIQPPAPRKVGALRVKTRPAPPRNEH